jgi:hypothetical protein
MVELGELGIIRLHPVTNEKCGRDGIAGAHNIQLVVGHFINRKFANFVVQIGHGISLFVSRGGIIPASRDDKGYAGWFIVTVI